MSLDVKWHYDSWPPTDEDVIVVFDTSTCSSVSNYPVMIQGTVKQLDKGIGFFIRDDIHPLHPQYTPVAWRYTDAFRRET